MIVQLWQATSLLSRWEQFFSNLLDVNQSTNFEGSEIYTVEPDIPESCRSRNLHREFKKA